MSPLIGALPIFRYNFVMHIATGIKHFSHLHPKTKVAAKIGTAASIELGGGYASNWAYDVHSKKKEAQSTRPNRKPYPTTKTHRLAG